MSEHTEEDEPPTAGTTALVEPEEQVIEKGTETEEKQAIEKVTETESVALKIDPESEKHEFNKDLVDKMYCEVENAINVKDKAIESEKLYNTLIENAMPFDTKWGKAKPYRHILEIVERDKETSAIIKTKYEMYKYDKSVINRGHGYDPSLSPFKAKAWRYMQMGKTIRHDEGDTRIDIKMMTFNKNKRIVYLSERGRDWLAPYKRWIFKVGKTKTELSKNPQEDIIASYNIHHKELKRPLTLAELMHPSHKGIVYETFVKRLLSEEGLKWGKTRARLIDPNIHFAKRAKKYKVKHKKKDD